MICPECGAGMNHHADKVEYALFEEGAEADFEGTVLQVFQCPQCPMVVSQPQRLCRNQELM